MLTINEIREAFMAQYGFDPSGIYCQVTGKQIGWTLIEEMDSLINLVGGESAEEVADDLAIRILASMRPSLKWNYFRSDSLADLRKSDPIETLAYLINRMFAPLNHRKLGISNLMSNYEHRIKTFKIVADWGVNDATNTLMYMLLEIDAKWSLDTESPPFSWSDFFNAHDMDARVSMLQAWYTNRMLAWEKRLQQEELQSRWIRHGSAIAKPAFQDAFMESKPLSVTALKKQEKAQEREFFGNLLFEIMGKPTQEGEPTAPVAAAPAPTFVPIRKMPARFGVKQHG